jgi:hypothetical protein
MSWLGWHWLNTDKKLQFGTYYDTIVVEPGVTLKNPKWYGVNRDIRLCECGYHASKKVLDALVYAPGPIVCRVKLGGRIIEGDDKAVAEERTCLWMAGATNVLYEFTYEVGNLALSLKGISNRCFVDTIMAKRRYVKGEINWADLQEEKIEAGKRYKTTDYEKMLAYNIASMTLLSSVWSIRNDTKQVVPLHQQNWILTNMISKLAPPTYKE